MCVISYQSIVQPAFWHRHIQVTGPKQDVNDDKKNNRTHVFRLGWAPLPRHTEERHAAFALPLQYSGFRFPFGAQQTVTSTDAAARRPRDFLLSPSLFSLPYDSFSSVTNHQQETRIRRSLLTVINHFTRSRESTLVSASPIRRGSSFDILNRLFGFTRVQ